MSKKRTGYGHWFREQSYQNPSGINRDFRMELGVSEEVSDIATTLSLIFGALSIFFKTRVFGWQAVILALMAIANSPGDKSGDKNMWTPLIMSVMGLVLSYTFPPSVPT